ncbi:hypothetical protein [Flagellimonas sp. CMM7]|uniref:hypothetical protein n=1 Tax=Flagellimonas sp. CMM7 TaxID=2654676 RepID=UPI0013D7D10A|nr:hypothetical protein [Flagellimonas sp. CMM7]UII80051.1 hypothetical protein LV704_00670 [Flagellimonas sp. CMM7]
MKPILKNFSGSGVFKYQIRPEMKPNIVSLNMYVYTPFNENYVFIDNAIGLYNSEVESSSEGLKKALNKAEDKWGLKLTKSDLQVA